MAHVEPTGQHEPVDLGVAAEAVDLTLPIGLLLATSDGRVGAANAAWCELSGLTREESGGFGWLACLPEDEREGVRRCVVSAAGGARNIILDRRLTTASGCRWSRWWMSASGNPYLAVAIAVADVEAEHELHDELRRQATYDPLTGLVARGPFDEALRHALAARDRGPGSPCLLFVDLDGFKAINDEHGHAVGDAVLVAVARILLDAVRPEDVVARVGGDEFVILCGHLHTPDDARAIAERIDAALAKALAVRGRLLRVGASIGIAAAGPDEGPTELLERADREMYLTKRRRGGLRPRPARVSNPAAADEADRRHSAIGCPADPHGVVGPP